LLAARLGAVTPEAEQDQHLIRIWGADEGMPVASVTDLAQTPEGYLWVGTLLSGLQRFDGVRFESYHAINTPALRSMGVRQLLVDRAGRLWINTYANSLALWDPGGFREAKTAPTRVAACLWASAEEVIFWEGGRRLLRGERRPQQWEWQTAELPGDAPPQFCADAEGRVWFLQTPQALGVWRPGHPQTVMPFPALAGKEIRVLTADGMGRIWVGTDGALAVWRGEKFEAISPPAGEDRLVVKRLIPTGANALWVEANGWLRRVAEGIWLAESPEWARQLGGLGALTFAVGDRRSGLWAGYREGGLIHVQSDGRFARLTTRDGLPGNTVRFVTEDREGNIWTGYERGNLVQVRRRPFQVIGPAQGLTEALVNSVAEDSEGAVWIGTHSGTVVRYKEGQCKTLSLPAPAASHNSVVTADEAGRVWIGLVGSGLWMHAAGQSRLVATRQELDGDPRILLPARDGRLWFGTLDAIWTWDGARLELRHKSGAAATSERPAALAEACDGTIWAGTFGGTLLRHTGAEFERIEPPAFRELGRLWALHPTPDGGLWIGTSQGGLLRYQGGEFRRYTTRDGLPSDFIAQVLRDAAGNLWLGTRVGIVRIAEPALARFNRGEITSLPVSIYGKTDGLLTIGCAIEYLPNCWAGRDGRLWFAMNNSVASVQPDQIRINPVAPTVVLEALLANGQCAWPTQAAAVLTSSSVPGGRSAPGIPPVRVGPRARDLEFHFTGLSLGSPQYLRFRHRLEGLDRDWVDADGRRHVVYRHVPPGEYVFRLIACNSDGVWSQDAAALPVRVSPFFYETLWFRLGLIALAAAGLVFAVRRVAHRRLRLRLAEVERQHALERERARIAGDLHDELGAGLTEVGLLGGLAQRVNTPAERVQEHLRSITDKAREMVTALDEIVWAMNPKHDSVLDLGRYFAEYASQLLQLTSLRCRLDVANDLPAHPLTSEQRRHLLLAFKEALTNVVRHANATEIRIRIAVEDGALEVRVEDDGRGMAQPDAPAPAEGLANMRRRMEQLGGTCRLSSEPGRGTTVLLQLPLRMASQGNYRLR
jgi:signal transduction histidine kinase/ligand-binding sensor domain-containing protein